MLNENWRRGERVVFSSEQAKKRGEMQVKVKVNFTLKQATKPQRGSRGVALLFP
jgi:polyisoprenoid-binding protein YceI